MIQLRNPVYATSYSFGPTQFNYTKCPGLHCDDRE